jgi:hypothetical protein
LGVILFLSTWGGRSPTRADAVRAFAWRRTRSPVAGRSTRRGEGTVFFVVAFVEVGKDASGLGFGG